MGCRNSRMDSRVFFLWLHHHTNSWRICCQQKWGEAAARIRDPWHCCLHPLHSPRCRFRSRSPRCPQGTRRARRGMLFFSLIFLLTPSHFLIFLKISFFGMSMSPKKWHWKIIGIYFLTKTWLNHKITWVDFCLWSMRSPVEALQN